MLQKVFSSITAAIAMLTVLQLFDQSQGHISSKYDVYVNETLLNCIPEENRHFHSAKNETHRWKKGYFLPVHTGSYAFNISLLVKEYMVETIEFRRKSEVSDWKTFVENDSVPKINTTSKYSVVFKAERLITGRLYHFIVASHLNIQIYGLNIIYQLDSNKLWKDAKKHIIKYTSDQEKIIRPVLGDWGSWTACNTSCGNGLRSRERICSRKSFSLLGRMLLPTNTSSYSECSNAVSCSGVNYNFSEFATSCYETCKQQGRICAQYDHEFEPINAMHLFEVLGRPCDVESTPSFVMNGIPPYYYINNNKTVCSHYLWIQDQAISCVQSTLGYTICPCAPQIETPIMRSVKHDHRDRLSVLRPNPTSLRLSFYINFTVLLFGENGTVLIDKKTAPIRQTWTHIYNIKLLTNYCLKMFISSRNGNSNTSGCYYFKTKDVPCASPSSISVALLNSTSIKISWHPLNSSCSYNNPTMKYEVLAKYGYQLEFENKFTTTFTSLVISGLEYLTMYCIKVKAHAQHFGFGPLSDCKNVTTQGGASTKSPVPTFVNVSHSHFDITWPAFTTQDAGDTKWFYRIYLSNGLLSLLETFDTNFTNCTFTGLTPMSTYFVNMSVVTSNGEGPVSPAINITTTEGAPLTAPPNFASTYVESRLIQLQWSKIPPDSNHVKNVSGYTIEYLKCAEQGVLAPYGMTVPNWNTFTVNLTQWIEPYSCYSIAIAGFNIAGQGKISSFIKVFTKESVPGSPPVNVSYVRTGTTSIRISWAPIKRSLNGVIVGYHVCIWDMLLDACSIAEYSVRYCNMTHSYSTSVQIGRLYCFKVSAFTKAGMGPRSPCRNVLLLLAPQGPPSSLIAYNSSSTSIVVEWQPVREHSGQGNITSYIVSIINLNTTYFTFNENTHKATFNNLEVYTRYQVKIQAVNKINKGPWSEIISVYTDEEVPSVAPSDFKVSAVTIKNISLTWKEIPVRDINGRLSGYTFEIKECSQSDNEYFLLTIHVESQITQYTLSECRPSTCYNINLAIFTSKGNGPKTKWVNATTLEGVPDAPPQNVTAFNTSSTSIKVMWSPVKEKHQNGIILGYRVFLTSLSTNTTTVYTVDALTLELNFPGLPKYSHYEVQILAFTKVGDGNMSSRKNVSTDEDVPSGPPQQVEATSFSSKKINITWQPVSANHSNGIIIKYRIDIKKCGGVVHHEYHIHQPPPKTSKMLGYIKPFTCYDMCIKAETVRGIGPCSNWVSVTTPQDVPSGSPQNVTTSNITINSTTVTWEDVLPEDKNGVIIGFKIQLKTTQATNVTNITTGVTFSHVFTKLKPYTEYSIAVQAFTVIGDGPWSQGVVVRTAMSVPDEPPQFLIAKNLSTTSLDISWTSPPIGSLNGIHRGYSIDIYRYTYKGELITKPLETILTCANSTSTIVNKLYKGTNYCIVASAFTDAGPGRASECSLAATNTEAPSAPPGKISVTVTGSTSLLVDWSDVPWDMRNGKVTGYTIIVSEAVKTTESSTLSSEGSLQITTPATTVPFLRTRLRRGINDPNEVDTKSRSYGNFRESGRAVSYENYRDSKSYRPTFGEEITYGVAKKSRNRRSTSNDIVIKLGPTLQSYEIQNLDKDAQYCITMYAHNTAGDGIHSTCTNVKTLRTDDVLPTIYKLQASPSSIIVTLNVTDFDHLKSSGFLKSFDLHMKELKVNGFFVDEGAVIRKVVKATNLTFHFPGLNVYTTYEVKVAAITRNGFGSYSEPSYIETCHCRSKIYTNWFVSPPFTNLKINSQASGIFPPILDDVIESACSGCELNNGPTIIDYTNDKNGVQTSLKVNKSMMTGNITEDLDISFPFSSKNNEVKYKGKYLPILHIPGLLLVSRNESLLEKYAKVVAGSIYDIWPIVVWNLIMLILAGIIIWTLERHSNAEQFPVPALKGVPEGAWWSFVTMTTIGYGDRYPITVLGRIFGIIWALVGISMNSIMIAAISSTLTITIVQEITTGIPRGTVIGAIAHTSDYDVAVEVGRAGDAQVKSFLTLEEMVFALKSKDIDSIVLDHFTAQSRIDLFNGTWFKVTDVVGDSFTYGVLLNGQAAKLERHFKEYIAANITKILDIASAVDKSITEEQNETEQTKIVLTENESINFLNPRSTIFQMVVLGMFSFLFGFGLIGMVNHFLVYRKESENKMNAELQEEYRERLANLKSTLEKFYSEFCFLNSELRKNIIYNLKQSLMNMPSTQVKTSPLPEPRRPIYQMRKSSLYNSEVEF